MFLDYGKFYGYHLYKSCENRSVGGARPFQALWLLLKGFLFFREKEGFFKTFVVLTLRYRKIEKDQFF